MSSITCFAQIKKSFDLTGQDVIRDTILKNGVQYLNIKIKNATSYGQKIGDPSLPVYHYTFYVPMNEEPKSVAFTSQLQGTININTKIIPIQPPVPTSIEVFDTSFVSPNLDVYNSNSIYPSQQARISHIDYLDDNLKLVTVEVYPMRYYPKSNRISYTKKFQIALQTTSSSNTNVNTQTRDKETYQALLSIVENPQTVISDSSNIFGTDSSATLRATSTWTVPFYEYVVVTTNALKSSFDEFIAWKKQKGYNAGVVAIEDILADPMATNGDAVSNINDNAGKLRQYLNAAYHSLTKTKYALLGGDKTVLPVRYATDNEYVNVPSLSYPDDQIASDLYFSDFNGNWNTNGNNLYGEVIGDNIDYGSEIFVGRLLCETSSEVDTWTKKLLKYECNPGNGDYKYLTNAFFTEADQLQDKNQAEEITKYLPTGFQSKILRETPSSTDLHPTGVKGADVINEINKNSYGLCSNFNHGCPTQYTVGSPGAMQAGNHDCYGVFGTNNVLNDKNSNYISESENSFDNLTNYDYPAVVYSVSCTNMPYEDTRHLGLKNLAQGFTTLNKGGGVAYLGNTNYGWVDDSYIYYESFLKKLTTVANNLGKAEAYSKSDVKVMPWINLTHNLIGCPETPMWTATPQLFSKVIINLHEDKTHLTVDAGVAGSTICVTSSLDGGTSYYSVDHNVSSHTFNSVPGSYKVVVTKTNYIPYIYEYDNYTSDCYIQDEIFFGRTIKNGTNFWIGENVTSSKPTGPVIIQSGANVTLNTAEVVSIYPGFEVDSGGQFEIK